jgi:hypothetical protein
MTEKEVEKERMLVYRHFRKVFIGYERYGKHPCEECGRFPVEGPCYGNKVSGNCWSFKGTLWIWDEVGE